MERNLLSTRNKTSRITGQNCNLLKSWVSEDQNPWISGAFFRKGKQGFSWAASQTFHSSTLQIGGSFIDELL